MPTPSTEDVILFAPLGSNPALLTSCVWALARQRSLRVVEAHVVLIQRGIDYLNSELLVPGGGLDQLHSVLGSAVLPRDKLHVHAATAEPGDAARVLSDDASEQDALAYQNAVVQVAHEVTRAAGDRRVVFAFLGGRRRTITVMATVVAQFMARRADIVLDLRLDPRDDMAGRFFFPEQLEPKSFPVGARVVRPAEVSVALVDVALPRLRHLVGDTETKSYQELLALGQSAIDQATPLDMLIDLRDSKRPVLVTDPLTGTSRALKLAPSRKLHLASLVLRPPSDGWCRVATAADPEHAFAKLCRHVDWAAAQPGLAVQWFADRTSAIQRKPKPDEEDVDKALSALRSRTRTDLHAFANSDARYARLEIAKRREAAGEALVHYQALRGVTGRVLGGPELR